MATIIPIEQTDGTRKWRATVRKKEGGVLVLNRSKTFSTKKLAETWATKLEAQVTDAAGLQRVKAESSVAGISLAEVIIKHRDYFNALKPFGETKWYNLKVLSEADFAQLPLNKLTSKDILAWFTDRRVRLDQSPGTISQYFGYLRQVFTLARPTFGISLDVSLLDDIRPTLKAAGIVGQGKERDRRLEPGEYRKLLTWFRRYDRTRSKSVKIAPLFRFSVRMPLRLGESCRINWPETDHKKRTTMIRDRKDPKEKKGNDQIVPILGKAWRIIEEARVPGESRIFPFRAATISTLFAQGVRECGIEDLHFHDLRHEGISRLFEAGYSVPEVALVSGHKTWNMLRRYTQLKAETLHRDKEDWAPLATMMGLTDMKPSDAARKIDQQIAALLELRKLVDVALVDGSEEEMEQEDLEGSLED